MFSFLAKLYRKITKRAIKVNGVKIRDFYDMERGCVAFDVLTGELKGYTVYMTGLSLDVENSKNPAVYHVVFELNGEVVDPGKESPSIIQDLETRRFVRRVLDMLIFDGKNPTAAIKEV